MRYAILLVLCTLSLAAAAQEDSLPGQATEPIKSLEGGPGIVPPPAEGPGVITPSIPGVPKMFLPDIGIAGDAAYELNNLPKTDPRYDKALEQPRIRDGQLVAFSPIDPYTNAQFTIDLPETGPANIEEAWLYFDKLPGDAAVRLGRYLPQFGLLDLTNTFQLAMVNRPSSIGNYLGSDGMDSTGVDVNFYVPNPWDLNLKMDLNAVRGDALGATYPTTDLAYLGTLDYSQDLFTTGSFQSGVSVAQGPSPYGRQQTLINPYVQIIYAPTQRRVWTWSAEGMFADRQQTTNAATTDFQRFRKGGYTFIDYNFALRYHVGFLADVVQVPGSLPVTYPGPMNDAFIGAPETGTLLDLAPNATWFVSDNTRLRLQYTHTTPLGPYRPNDTVSFQATFSLGNLKQLD